MREFLVVADAVKMIQREMEKFPEMTFREAFKEYNDMWFNGELTIEDQAKILKWMKWVWLAEGIGAKLFSPIAKPNKFFK